MQQRSVETGGAPAMPAPQQYLTFLLGGEMFGLGILRGVINLRGAVVPVMDVQLRFGRSASAITKRSCIVIVEIARAGEQQVLGLLVDAVSEVVEIAPADIADAPSFGAGIHRDFIRGMAKRDDRFVILLDADAVLANDAPAQLPDAALAA